MATQRTKQRPRLRPGGAKSAGPARRALLVAINDYGNPQNDLPSCLEDAAQFRSVLQDRYGFDDITELYDADATVDGVEDGLAWLFDGVGEDDRLVFFYSGHGYQQPRNGNLEECLVLTGRAFFFDDRLSELSQSAPPGVLTVVLDSCFSGGMQKRIPIGNRVEIARTKLWMPPAAASREKALAGGILVPRPFGCLPVTGRAAVEKLVLGARAGAGPKAPEQTESADEAGQLQLNGLLLSACSENETASAGTSATEGMSAFTCALMRTLPASGDIAVTELQTGVRDQLAEMGFQQTPLLRLPENPGGLDAASFVTLAPLDGTEGQPAKILPANIGSTAPHLTEDKVMSNQQYDDQFWRTVERVSAQVAMQAGNEAPAGNKSASRASPGARSRGPNGPQEASGGPTTRPAVPGRNGQARRVTNGRATAAPVQSAPGYDGAGDQWIGAAMSLVEPVAGALLDAIQEGRLEAASSGGNGKKLAKAVSALVTPTIVDAVAERPDDFAFGTPADASGDDDPEGDEDSAELDSAARVVAASVSSIVAELAGSGVSADEQPAEPETDPETGQKIAPVIGAALITAGATLAAPVVHHAIDAWRKRRRKDLEAGGTPDDAADDKDGIASYIAARIGGEVVEAVVGVLSGGGGKLFAPPSMHVLPYPAPGLPKPRPLPAPVNRRGSNRRYYAAA
jgi:hypothetical protein